MNVTREDLAWAAGLFEGEGTFSRREQKKPRPGRIRHDRSLLVRIKMTDEHIIRRFANIVSVGNVTGPYAPDGLGTKPFWVWQTGRFEHAQATMAMLWFYLGTRRKKRIKELLTGYVADYRTPNGVYEDAV